MELRLHQRRRNAHRAKFDVPQLSSRLERPTPDTPSSCKGWVPAQGTQRALRGENRLGGGLQLARCGPGDNLGCTLAGSAELSVGVWPTYSGSPMSLRTYELPDGNSHQSSQPLEITQRNSFS